MIHKIKLIVFILLFFIILPISDPKTVPAATIKISSQSFTLAVNHYKTLYITGTSNKVIWTSSNKAIATVSTTGRVIAKAPGTAIINASISGKKLYCRVTVIKLNSGAVTLTEGSSTTLKVYGTTNTATWSSGNQAIAIVSKTGTVTAKTPGTATIYASVSGKKLFCIVTVTKLITLSSSSNTSTTARIIGYYAGWSRYSGYSPDIIEAAKLTHINYAFANIGSDLKISLGYPDVDPSNINSLNKLKQKNPNLKTIISVGGYSWSKRFSDVALTATSRVKFADSCINFIVKYGFDGIDIDWEYPVAGGMSGNIKRPEDKHNYTLLLKTLREKLDARGAVDGKHYILSFAGAAGTWYISHIEPNLIRQYVDYVNIMTYDLHGTWESHTNFNSPLYSNDPLHPNNICVNTSVINWIKAGFPISKLVIGIPFYGYIYKAVTNANNGFYQTYSGGATISYNNIAANYLNASGYLQFYDQNSRVPWLFNGSTFITYENKQSISEKAQYIKNNGLSGVMIWELSQDRSGVLLNSLYQVFDK